jgi:hypothetical protein
LASTHCRSCASVMSKKDSTVCPAAAAITLLPSTVLLASVPSVGLWGGGVCRVDST